MTVGFYCPLPPARTGVADYGAALLTELRRRGNVDVCPERCDIALYHIGNNGLHANIYRRALERPGVLVLHDVVLQHLLLGALPEEEYVEEFVFNYGEWSRALALELWRERSASAVDGRYFQYPMLRRAAERALAVVVHNPEAARIARTHAPHARVLEIPHLYTPPPNEPSESEIIRFRQRLGLDPGAFLFGIFGYLRESKRLISVLEAFARLRAEQPRAALLVAGDFVSSDLERVAEPLLRLPGVVRQAWLPDPDFQLAAAAVDACVNLRSPAAGETSGIAIRLMGQGKPVLLTDSAEYARFPQDTCIRIPAGPQELESLLQHFRLLTSLAEVAPAIGRRGSAHIRNSHGVEQAGQQYWDLLCDFCA